jgi:hypothetical protein
MPMRTRQEVLKEMIETRSTVAASLQSLREAQAQSEARLRDLKRPDVLKAVTGKSSLENAIASAQRMVEMLDRSIEELRQGAEPVAMPR